ncbi:hypothetical protein HOLleu_01187 [Holothuria leucospilota]|uniref:Uncharacterized protein n=1 Tax=Holothuria leucospilota TaxID=206669 RepID=A0A9Q1HK45_HOLLE|nr:hypothetical protein HOLleu_01187 [Holothuria leucospilota]
MIHTKTRNRELVDRLYVLGLSISYDPVLAISTELGDKICHYYKMEKAVCPPELKGGLFTTATVDNIDHNPSSTSAHDLFHGTGISLFQHPDNEFSGASRAVAYTHRDAAGAKKNVSISPLHQCTSCCSSKARLTGAKARRSKLSRLSARTSSLTEGISLAEAPEIGCGI